jgi:hypothetical protein
MTVLLPPIEGYWLGPDKIAHVLVPIAVTGWVVAFKPSWYAWGPIIGVTAGMAWEISNWFWVVEGSPGVSLMDAMGFFAGGLIAGMLALAHRRLNHGR